MKKSIRCSFLLLAMYCFPVSATNFTNVNFVVMGGYTSCNSRSPQPTAAAMYKPFRKMLSSLERRYPRLTFHFVVSCLQVSTPPDGPVLFTTSDKPNLIRIGTTENLRMLTEEFLISGSKTATFVIGHSYGGWMAMDIAEQLNSDWRLQGLFTIDPISPLCNVVSVLLRGKNCHRAPLELNNVTIANQTARWINFFENQDSWIHSSAIDLAENIEVPEHGPHNLIDIDSNTWTPIQNAVEQRLN